MGLICITLSGMGLPGVNLIIYKDDLRMMAPKLVVSREGGMKDIAECIGLFMRFQVKGCRSLFGRGNGVACWEETSGLCGKRTLPPQRLDPGSSHPTKALRALARTPTGRDDTVYSLSGLVSGAPFHHSTFPPFHLKYTFPHPFQVNRKSPGTLRPQGFVL